jgi:hypothetical protein
MSNSLISKTNNIHNQSSKNIKISDLTTIELLDLINNLKSENSTLQTQLKANRKNLVSYSLYENSLKQKDKIISDLHKKYENLQHEFNEYKLNFEKKYEEEIIGVRMLNDSTSYKIENVLKIENLNNLLYCRVLELENLISNFGVEEKKKIDNIKLNYENKMEVFRKKMVNYIKKEYDNYNVDSNLNKELNNILTSIHLQELIEELDFCSKKIEDLLKERENLKRKVKDLSNDIKIYEEVLQNLERKNKKYQEQLHEISQNINYDKIKNVINTYNDKKSISSEKNLLSNASIMSFVNNSKSRNINRTINISNTTENIKKPLIKVLNTNSGNNNFSNENYKIKYETVSSKLNLINIKYGNLIKLYDEILTKLYKENFNNNIYLNINDFKEFNFNNLNEEEKYAIVVTLINNIFPLVNKENIENENILNKLGKFKIKYFNNNFNKNMVSNSNLPSLSNIDNNTTVNSEKLNKNLYYINNNNFSSTIYNNKKRNKLDFKGNKIQINSFSFMKFN